MKICLIFPPLRDAVKSMMIQVEDSESGGIGFKPPLGILYIAGYLKSHQPRHEVMLIDAQVERLDISGVVARALNFSPDIIGITAWTDFWCSTHRIIAGLRKALPSAHICVGGPHADIYPDITLNHSDADSVILGDGELPFSLLVERLEQKRPLKDMPFLYTKESSKPLYEYHVHKDLNELSYPDRRLLPYKKYYSIIGKEAYATTMITSRGCPYRCVFCKLNFQKPACRSAENVVSEFEEILKLGISDVEIYDDTFTWSRQRVIDICEKLLERDLKVTWAIRDRVNKVDDKLLDLMYRAGCRRIHYGIESGLDKTLVRIKKNITADQASDAVKMAKAHGFEVLAYFMLGLPGETEDDMRSTIDFALKLKPDYATFNVAVPYPCTEMYDTALKDGIIPQDYWSEFAKRPTPNFVIPHFYEEFLDKADLFKMRNFAIRSFYFRPSLIFNELKKIKSPKELGRKFRLANTLFKESFLLRSRHIYDKI